MMVFCDDVLSVHKALDLQEHFSVKLVNVGMHVWMHILREDGW